MKLTREDVGKEKLEETDEREMLSAWREHYENVVVWKDGRGGTSRRYSYDDDQDNHNKQNKLGSVASGRVMSESEQAEEDRRDDGHGQFFRSATTAAASARKACSTRKTRRSAIAF